MQVFTPKVAAFFVLAGTGLYLSVRILTKILGAEEEMASRSVGRAHVGGPFEMTTHDLALRYIMIRYVMDGNSTIERSISCVVELYNIPHSTGTPNNGRTLNMVILSLTLQSHCL